MLSWPITMLLIALMAALLSLLAFTGMAAGIAQAVSIIFLILCLVSLLFGKRGV